MSLIRLRLLTMMAFVLMMSLPVFAQNECRSVRMTNTGFLSPNTVEGMWEGDINASYIVHIHNTITSTDSEGNTILYAVGTAIYVTDTGEIRTVDTAQIQLAPDGSGSIVVHQVVTGGTEFWANTTGAVNAFNDHAPDVSFSGQATGEVCRPEPFN